MRKKKDIVLAARTHLEGRKFFVKERHARRRFKNVEEGSLCAYAGV